MVQVIHWNRRLLNYKFLFVIVVIAIFIFVHIFEIGYHCTQEEPIDAVYTWVNGSDPRFLETLNFYRLKYQGFKIDSSPQRYDDKDELKFSLRSLEKYAPWIRRVYIVTNGQIPYWLNLDYEKVILVTHEEIFMDVYNVPTFSSPAIEAHLHRIRGLSKRFIYFNDDIFLRSPVYRDDFYTPSRGFAIYLSWLLPMCSSECSWVYVADGHCDNVCNNPDCQMDGGDCAPAAVDDHEGPDERALSMNFTLWNLHQRRNVSEIVTEHNRKILLLDKLRRRKGRKKVVIRYNNVDAYAESLQHTNRVLNEFYGFAVRRVPSHAPIMIDRDVMEEMATKFSRYFEKTARNRFRSADDLQFAFAYYYFVIEEKNTLTIGDIFDRFDTDLSGVWSDNEIRTLIAKSYTLPITDQTLADFSTLFINCSGRSITKEFLERCLPLSSFLKSRFGEEDKYKFDVIKDAEKKHVSFKMLTSNLTEVEHQLDEVRRNDRKFVCLNDNLNQFQAKENAIVRSLMLELFSSLFPDRSKFELPRHYRNKFLNMDDYSSLIKKQNVRFSLSCLLLFAIVFVLFVKLFRRRVCEFVSKCFY